MRNKGKRALGFVIDYFHNFVKNEIMAPFESFKLGVKPKPESLIINFKSRRIDGHWIRCRYIDKETNHFVVLYPALGLTGYGNTEEEAMEMIKFSLDELCKYLISSPISVVQKFLKENNWTWKQPLFPNKRAFSHSYIDSEGQLQNLNAKEGSVKVSYQNA
jgi:hypothetical protein